MTPCLEDAGPAATRRADLLKRGWPAPGPPRQGVLGSWSLDPTRALPQQDLNHWHQHLRQAGGR